MEAFKGSGSAMFESEITSKITLCHHHGKFISQSILLPFQGKSKKSIWSQCPKCAHVKNEKEAREKNLKQAHEAQIKIERMFARASIPKRFLSETFETYIADTSDKKNVFNVVYEFAENFKKHAEKGTNLILSGGTGTGKEHLALSVAKKIIPNGHGVFFTTLTEMIMRLRASWRDPKASSELEVLKMLTSTSLLIIDEIGVGFNTDAERDQLFNVIDGRYRDLMPTIFTTNLTTSELRHAIGERSFSRIRQNGVWVKLNWEDFRASKSHLRLAASKIKEVNTEVTEDELLEKMN
jgi:DNA replication protein DnaC